MTDIRAKAERGRPTVLLIGPVPPPTFGVAEATRLMLDSPVLKQRLRIVHLDTSDVRDLATMGKLEWRNLYLGVKHLLQLLSLLARERPDITLLTLSQGKFALMRDGLFASAARTFRSRTVSYLRGSGYADIARRQGWLSGRVLRSLLKHSARVLVLGQNLVGMAHSVYPGSVIAVVPNGCTPAVPAEWVGMRDETRPVMAYLGALSPAKGVTDALLAARDIVAKVPSLEFSLVGQWSSQKYEIETRRLVKEQGLSNSVRFPGPEMGEGKQALLARAWVLVVPSHSEGQPWVILEAMSAGLPVVATDTGAIPETVHNGVSGFVVPVGDQKALARWVIELVSNEDLWKHMSRESLRLYEERFTLEHSHRALADVLEHVAEGK